ncbi:MAG: glucan biosynthesis protein, partial [Hyphomicrobiaceae bacterium]
MATSTWDRRTLLATAATAGAAAAAWPLLGGTGTGLAQGTTADEAGETFAPDTVRKLAQTLAGKPFAKPKIELPEPFNKLVYDQYRDIRFRPDQAIWRGEKLGYELQLFPLGWLYDAPLDIWIVDNGRARLLKGDSRLFTFGPVVGNNRPPPTPYGFSGFRVHTPINRSDTMDEFVVFQGASYLRAVGRGQGYGLSARGLAINTARPNG